MNIIDLDSLKQTTLEWAARTGEDAVEDNIDAIVQLAEAKINRLLRVDSMLANVAYTASDSTNEFTLPDDFGSVFKVKVNGISWQWRPHDELTREGYEPQLPIPGFYTIIGCMLQVAPAISSGLTLIYYRLPPALYTLETGKQYTTMLLRYPDLYLYGALSELIIFDRAYDEATIWEGKFNAVLQQIQRENSARRYPRDQALISSVAMRGRRCDSAS